ncbi:hypothetical protein ACC807_17400 [Rhizobium ruizarguesonis]|uniref:hypothetical protein n=1 Tax=Rhizobium ruizarguesonis TaxID=2081791 RepID=UPI0013D403F4|nr:hypothetical protein [Rhizobium ruizarguesonis]MBY5882835.1 hypothetical protein [Rhizobium leguminosarum]
MKAGFLLSAPAGQHFSSRLLPQDCKCFIVEIEIILISLFSIFIYMVAVGLDRGNWNRSSTHPDPASGHANPPEQCPSILDRLAVPIFSAAQFFRVITWVAQITAPATEQFSLRTKRGYR